MEEERVKKDRKGMKKIWKVLLVIVCILAVIIGTITIISHAVYHRSTMATMAEWVLAITKDRSSEEETAEKLAVQKQGEEPVYIFDERLESSVKEESYQNLRIYTLNENDASPILIYTHGGAYVQEIGAGHWSMLDKIASQSGCEVRSIVYPLAPWHTWEDSYPSITEYYASVREAEPDRQIFFSGDSAGGGLALGVSINIVKEGYAAPDGLTLISPWVEATETNPEIPVYEKTDPMLSSGSLQADAQAWAGDEPLEDWHVSPINGELSGLRNVHIFVGTREMFYPDNVLLYEKLQNLGVESCLIIGEGMNHVYPMYPIPEADRAVSRIADILAGE